MVYGAGEVLVEDERHAARFAKPAIGEADAVGFDELRRRGLVGVNRFRATNDFRAAVNHDGVPL
jgi:hypothetical protein